MASARGVASTRRARGPTLGGDAAVRGCRGTACIGTQAGGRAPFPALFGVKREATILDAESRPTGHVTPIARLVGTSPQHVDSGFE